MAGPGNLRKRAERLLKERRWGGARELYAEQIRQQPQDVEAWLALGKVSLQLNDEAGAEQALRRAIELRPNLGAAYEALARLQIAQGRLHEAESALRTALAAAPAGSALQPLLEQVLHQRGLVTQAAELQSRQRYDEALALLEEALTLNPRAFEAHWRHTELLLLLGRFSEGWDAYERRIHDPRWIAAMGRCEFAAPRWQGEPLQGKTLLVYAEQGFGDTLQFSRYLPLLHERGARIIFYVDRELLPLFENSRVPMRVEAKSYQKALTERFDYHIPLMSLPHLFGTTLDTIPAQMPYIQVPDERRAVWQTRLSGEGFKIGLVWAGRDSHPSNAIRSCGLEVLAPLSQVAGVKLYSLQKGSGALSTVTTPSGMEIEDLAPQLNDFADTAAAIERLDLVISVDTAVAHLAGALGKQVWTLIYHPPEWRWLLQREDSPWYPSMRLFRQRAEDGGWAPVIARVVDALRAMLQR